MNPERLILPKSKPAPVAVSNHRASSSSVPTEKSPPFAVRGRKFSGLDPFTLSLVAGAPIVTPAVRVARKVVRAAPPVSQPEQPAPSAIEPVVIEPVKPRANRGVLALGAMLAVGLAGMVGLQGRPA